MTAGLQTQGTTGWSALLYPRLLKKISRRIQTAEIIGLANPGIVNFNELIPANAFIIGVYYEITTPATTSGAPWIRLDIGNSSDGTAHYTLDADLKAAAGTYAGNPGLGFSTLNTALLFPSGTPLPTPSLTLETNDGGGMAAVAGDFTCHIVFAQFGAP